MGAYLIRRAKIYEIVDADGDDHDLWADVCVFSMLHPADQIVGRIACEGQAFASRAAEINPWTCNGFLRRHSIGDM